MNPAQFYKRWREGMQNLRPEQLLKANVVGHAWAILGLLLAIGWMAYKQNYVWILFVAALTWLEAVKYIQSKQQYDNMKRMLQEDMK